MAATMKPFISLQVQPHFFNQIGNPTPNLFYSSQRSVVQGRCLSSCKPNQGWLPMFERSVFEEGQALVNEFNPEIGIQEALTPPSSWYTHPSFLSLELDRVFYTGWQAVGNVEYVVCRDDNGDLHAFHNVCHHHASLLAFGSWKESCFICPYHGWTYGLDGTLLKATRITGIRNFNIKEFGLLPLRVAVWGPFILLDLQREISKQNQFNDNIVGNEWLGSSSELLSTNSIDNSLSYLCRREYTIDCNWKVFCDNYLDGGYQVPYAHKALASGLKLESYSTTLFKKVSIQSCDGGQEDFDRLGAKSLCFRISQLHD